MSFLCLWGDSWGKIDEVPQKWKLPEVAIDAAEEASLCMVEQGPSGSGRYFNFPFPATVIMR